MARAMVRLTALFAIAVLCVPAFTQQPAQDKKDSPPPAKPAQREAGGLDELLSQALKNNPDIRVGEAKVRETEAELHRTRMTVAQKVASLYYAIDVARKVRDETKERLNTITRLYNLRGGVESEESMRTAKLTFQRAVAELAKIEAEMPALLGKLPGNLGEKLKADAAPDMRATVGAGIRYLRDLQALDEDQSATHRALAALALSQFAVRDLTPQGSLADRIRKALDKQITADYKDKPLVQVLNEIGKHLDGIPLRITYHFSTAPKMDLNLGQVPLGTVIQAFNDLTPEIRFVVRDYGILVAEKGNLPPGALELYEFWKSDVGKSVDKLKERDDLLNAMIEETNARLSHERLPRAKGKVKSVDEKEGLVTFSIGNDGELSKGQSLYVYRLEPTGVYIGMIRILEVRPSEAVGKSIGKFRVPVKIGDEVSSRIQ